MNKFIEKNNYINLDDLSEESFFKELLVNCYEKNLLEDGCLEKIYYERLELLKTQLKYYTKDASSSVMIEVAESILECIDYTIGIYLKTFKNVEFIISTLKKSSLFDIYTNGQDLIKVKISESKKLLCEIQENKLKVNNYSYNDTIDYGIPLFFKEYEDFYSAHETPGSIDYQLSLDNFKTIGIEYINNYLEKLNFENKFCSYFNINDINELLQGYDKNCHELLINIFELVLINSLGSIISSKDPTNLHIKNTNREQIKNKLANLSLIKLQEELLSYAKKCCLMLGIKDEALANYIKNSTIKITSLINESLKLNKLETVFISFNENHNDNEIIEYIDGKKMSNTYFRKLTERIKVCVVAEDKIKLIRKNIYSLEDLIDILEAECLYEDEFNNFFKSLSDIEIALLLKDVPDLNFQNQYEKEWHIEFNKYFSCLSEEKQKIIRSLQEKIKLV